MARAPRGDSQTIHVPLTGREHLDNKAITGGRGVRAVAACADSLPTRRRARPKRWGPTGVGEAPSRDSAQVCATGNRCCRRRGDAARAARACGHADGRGVLTRRAARRAARGAVGGDGSKHRRAVPGRRSARRLSARRSAGHRRRQRLGHQHRCVRVVLPVRSLTRDARRRPVQLLHRLVSARDGQRRHPDLQVGDVPDPGTARLPRGQQGHPADGQRGGGSVDVRWRGADPGDLASRPVHLRGFAVGFPQSRPRVCGPR